MALVVALIRYLAGPVVRRFPEERRDVVLEFLTYCTVGVVNTLFGQLLFNIFLGLGALTANTISVALATLCSFVLNRNITYRDRARTPLRRELPLFIFLNLINLGIQQGVLDSGRRIFDIAPHDRLGLNIVRACAVIIGMVFLMLTYRTFVFKKKRALAAVAPAEVLAGAPTYTHHVASAGSLPLGNEAMGLAIIDLDTAGLDTADLDGAELDATELDTAELDATELSILDLGAR